MITFTCPQCRAVVTRKAKEKATGCPCCGYASDMVSKAADPYYPWVTPWWVSPWWVAPWYGQGTATDPGWVYMPSTTGSIKITEAPETEVSWDGLSWTTSTSTDCAAVYSAN
jgi:hypothetical protein